MENIEKENINTEFGIALDESASSLTNGPGGHSFEGAISPTGIRR